MRISRRPCASSERGDIMPAAIAAAFLLMMALCAVIDPSCAMLCKTVQENSLANAKEACMQPAFAMAQKNSDTPGRDVAERVVASLRASGFGGEAVVYYYEAPESATGPAKRLYVVGIQVMEDYETIVSRGVGVESLPVASNTVFSAIPYSEERAWRPAEAGSGSYTSSGPGAALSFTGIAGLEGFPEEVAAVARNQAEQLNK